MEKYNSCKLCFRRFANGRALGGHMRSHMMNLYVQKQEEKQEISEEMESVTWSVENGEKGKILGGDVDDDLGVVLPDKESETDDQSSNNPTRFTRSKRVRKSRIRNPKFVKVTTEYSSLVETEPVSSISENSPEEDVAHCLMMLSRDTWIVKQEFDDHYSSDSDKEEGEGEGEAEEEKSEDSGVLVKVINTKIRGKYRCETCNKVFKSYQALGGHRASHKKIKVSSISSINNNQESEMVGNAVEEKVHECPVCYRVFSSGQALGGHKRTHVMMNGAAATNVNVPVLVEKPENSRTGGGSLLDLNFPPPMEDNYDNDDEIISQVEVSAVSEAEFVKPH